MIREGILFISNEMLSQWKDDKMLPSVDYINLMIKSEDSNAMNDFCMPLSPWGSPSQSKKKPEFPNKLLSKKQQIKNYLLEIKNKLEEAKYSFENWKELKRISQILSNEHSSIHTWKESLTKLRRILMQDGMTYFEASESKIISSLHTFLIEWNDESNNDKSLLNRIYLFASEMIENEKCTNNLISIINSDAFIDELHLNNRDWSSFILKNRFSEIDQVKITWELKVEDPKSRSLALDSFMDSMMKYEIEDESDYMTEFNPFFNRGNFKPKEPINKETWFYERVKKFTIVAPSDFSLKQLEKYINERVNSIDELEKLYKKKNLDVYIESHCYFDNSYDYAPPGKSGHTKSSPKKPNLK